MQQRIDFTRTITGVDIAYALSGSGPFLIFPPPWVSHLELGWALPAERRFYEVLSRGRTLVRYDRPGCGLSSRTRAASESEVLEAVVRAVGAETFDILGTSMGTFVAVEWAAVHPSSVTKLLLYGGWVKGNDVAPPAVREHVLGLVRERWGLGSDLLADILMAEADQTTREAFVRYQRESATAEVAAAILEQAYSIDLSPLLNQVSAPTLVMHRENDRAAPAEQGRLLARSITGARFVLLPGRTHVAFLGDAASILKEIRRFLGLPAARFANGPVLTKRQMQVAEMVAEGLTNRDISHRLGIDERSAEGHIERIRNRLGFRSRAQIAAWWALSGK